MAASKLLIYLPLVFPTISLIFTYIHSGFGSELGIMFGGGGGKCPRTAENLFALGFNIELTQQIL